MRVKSAVAALTLAFPVPALCQSTSSQPQLVDLADRADVVSEAASRTKATLALEPGRKIVVEGERPMTSMVLAAKEIEFKPGSKIVISDSDQSSGNFFVVADRIVIDDPEKPGVITWGRTSLPPPPPPLIVGKRPRAAAELVRVVTVARALPGQQEFRERKASAHLV